MNYVSTQANCFHGKKAIVPVAFMNVRLGFFIANKKPNAIFKENSIVTMDMDLEFGFSFILPKKKNPTQNSTNKK